MAQLSLRDLLHPDMGDWESREEAEALAQNAAPGQEADLLEFEALAPGQDEHNIDELLLAASQQFEQSFESDHNQAAETVVLPPKRTRFGSPVSASVVEKSRKAGIQGSSSNLIYWSSELHCELSFLVCIVMFFNVAIAQFAFTHLIT